MIFYYYDLLVEKEVGLCKFEIWATVIDSVETVASLFVFTTLAALANKSIIVLRVIKTNERSNYVLDE